MNRIDELYLEIILYKDKINDHSPLKAQIYWKKKIKECYKELEKLNGIKC